MPINNYMITNFYVITTILFFILPSCSNNESQEVEELITAKNYTLALNEINRLLSKGKGKENPKILYLKGFLEDKIGDIDTAATYYILYLGHKSDEPDVWNNLGNIFNEKGKYIDALTCFQNAIELGQDDKIPLINKAKVEFNLERYSIANRTLHNIINMGYTFNADDSLLYGADLYFLDSLVKAEMIYNKISKKKFTPDAFENYYITLLKIGKEAESKNILLKALSTYPNEPMVLNMASHFYSEIKPDFEKSKAYCYASIEQNPRYDNLAYQNLCSIYRQLNQRDSCCILVNKLVQNNISIYSELERYCSIAVNN